MTTQDTDTISEEISEKKNFTWLITGGAGFLGLHVCNFLAERGENVISYDIDTAPKHEKPEGLIEITADIRDTTELKKALKGVDYVVHCAAALALAKPEVINSVNAEGTKTVLDASVEAGVKRFIYISSTAMYGMPKYHPIYEDADLDPMGDYGIAKAKAEKYVQEIKGMEWTIIRPKSFIGTGRLGIFQILFDWIESGRKIPVLGDGENIFQLLSVSDLSEAIYLAALKATPNEIFNIGTKDFGTVNRDVGAMLDAANTGSRLLHVPSKPVKFILSIFEALHISPVYRWVYDTADQDSFVSTEKAEKDFGFSPKDSNQSTLIATYKWYLKEGKEMAKQHGTGHRVAWKQGILGILKHLF